MSSLAFVFPGQGSQSVGMLAELSEKYSIVRDTFNECSDALGFDLGELILNGPSESLNQTENTQPALLAAGVAVWRAWHRAGGNAPKVLSGHSLGEYSALVCANALTLKDGVNLVRERGRLMQNAVPQGLGAMAAILGADDEVIQLACNDAAQSEVVAPANFNSPGQTVIAGHASAVERVIFLLAERGVRKAMRLPVSVPSHCDLMREAAVQLGETMRRINWSTPEIPIIQNADAKSFDSTGAIQAALIKQLYLPVRWTECVQELKSRGATNIIECGPGKVLAGLIKRIDKEIPSISIGNVADFDATLAA